jgi:pimeloyl-ACP methyl ester carboxylesterase
MSIFSTFIHDMTPKSVVWARLSARSPIYRVMLLCKDGLMTAIEIYQPKAVREERRLVIRGVDYCLYEWGSADAPLFVYLHGWGDTGATFQFVVDALRAGWRVIAPDWRGFGRSPCRSTGYWFPDYLADLHALLQVVSPAAPVRLVGHSMGANVAALFAGTFPERVLALVNVEGFGLPDSKPKDAPSRYRTWIEAATDRPAFTDYDDFAALTIRIGRRNPGMTASQALFVATEWGKQSSDGKVRLRADPLHKLPNPVLYRRAEAEACWRAATAATLLVTGGQSRFARELPHVSGAPIFADAETVVIEDAGHMLHFETPAPLATAIEDFLLPTL